MERWEENYICEQLPQLVKLTQCTTFLKALLRQNGLITGEEADLLTSVGHKDGSLAESKRLYDILKTRRNAYSILLKALHETRQTGAYVILKEGTEKHAVYSTSFSTSNIFRIPIGFNNAVKPLSEVFPYFTEEDAQELFFLPNIQEELTELLTDESKVVKLDGGLPLKNPIYIPRRISRTVTLNPDIFKLSCPDAFVFKGIDRQELVKWNMPYVTRSSVEQLSRVTCRHIFLEDDEDWEDLITVSTSPMHLVLKQGDDFKLLKSTCVTETILDNLMDDEGICRDTLIDEDQFSEILHSEAESKTVLLCDIPGMGKTLWMQSIAHKLQQSSQNTCILYTQVTLLSNFLRQQLANSLKKEHAVDVLAGFADCSKLASYLLLQHGSRNRINLVLFLDGFEDVSLGEIDMTLSSLKLLKDNVQIIISARLHLRRKIETTFNLISYKLLPLQMSEQINLMLNHWKLHIPITESEELLRFAEKCIRSLSRGDKKQPTDMLGVPLKCYMLAVIYETQARKISISNKRKQEHLQRIDTMYSVVKFYQKFVEMSINMVDRKADLSKGSTFQNNLISYHAGKAVTFLFPEIANVSGTLQDSKMEYVEVEIIRSIGLLDYKTSGSTFLDRAVAEYMVAKVVVDVLTGIDSAYTYGIPVADLKLCEILFQTFPNGERAIQGVCLDGLLVKIKTSAFLHANTLEFLSELIERSDTNISITAQQRLLSFMKENLFTVIMSSIDANFVNVLNLLRRMIKNGSVYYRPFLVASKEAFVKPKACLASIFDNWLEANMKTASAAYIMYQIAAKGTLEVALAIFEMFSDKTYNFFQEMTNIFPSEWPSPVQVAIQYNNIDVLAYFSEKIVLNSGILRFCLVGQTNEKKEKIRLRACKAIIRQESRHVTEFLNALENENHMFKYNINLLNQLCITLNIDLMMLSIQTKRRFLDAALLSYNDDQFITLLLLLFAPSQTIDCLTIHGNNATVHQVFRECVSFKNFNIAGAREALSGINCAQHDYFFNIKGTGTLKVLTDIYDNFSTTNSLQRTLLHISVSECKLEWIKVLVKDKRFNVNQTDTEGNTPLLCINAWDPIEITKLLIENGANVYAVNKRLQNVAHVLLQHYTKPESTYIAWIKMMLELGHNKLWHEQDDEKNTPLELMEAKWGHQNPFSHVSHLVEKEMPRSRRVLAGVLEVLSALL